MQALPEITGTVIYGIILAAIIVRTAFPPPDKPDAKTS